MMEVLANLGLSLLFGLLGIIIMAIGYVVFDKVIPADFNKELENKNTAVAIVIAGMLIGVAIIVSKVIA
ncbi:DUF350 domain-containing protein [Clostridium manihotivorum]|uniref:DUF350 domain-containing protein n=1 Tax=Clostridium manihotivorum TaxID=2320868 RepID=A0A3R5QX30_9CLOT|nr:DUF350 domain-containing protein [Clostridium manihotivorum]QAA31528.1 DUF350 domain-containing protein [Clostridium manihotivorum]